MILELIGQPHFDLKWNNSQNVWNKCTINCFIIDSLSSNFKDRTTHLSMHHCFHVIIGTQCLHVRHPGKDKSFQNLYLTVIFQIIIKCGAHAQNSKSPLFYFCCFWINVTQINFENIKERYNESFLIIVSSWNRDLMLMLERPLSHYWTSPLK